MNFNNIFGYEIEKCMKYTRDQQGSHSDTKYITTSKITNKNIISLGLTECRAFLQDYAKLILKYKIQPDSTEDGSKRFKGTPYPVSLKTAEQEKLDALSHFQKSLCSQPS